jgi:hypothetical protein
MSRRAELAALAALIVAAGAVAVVLATADAGNTPSTAANTPSAAANTPSTAANTPSTAGTTGKLLAATAKPWSFAIEADTQWSVPDEGENPNSVSVGIVAQLDRRFIAKRVKFVVEVGDLCDNGTVAGEDTRAVFAQELYDAGIGFYPLVGNHDDGATDARCFTTIYPQTQTAIMAETPASAFSVPNLDALRQPFPTPSGRPFRVGTISASPAAPHEFAGLDYAVDYRNARLVFLDQFTGPAPGAPAHAVLDSADVEWMNAQLASRPAGGQAFVFGHKGILTESHTDTLFGADPAADPSLQDGFISDLAKNGVHYYIGGHDHMYNRALVASPDFKSSVQDIIAQSDASSFGVPRGAGGGAVAPLPDAGQTNDTEYDVPAFGKPREEEIAQQAGPAMSSATTATVHVGYFIVTVDGPQVTVDYYSAPVTAALGGFGWAIRATPALSFTRQETFGYSLNGREFFVPEGGSYRAVADRFGDTRAQILGGVNKSTATDAAGRKLTRDVTTGWARRPHHCGLASSILTLEGLANVGAPTSDTYALAMSTDKEPGRGAELRILESRNARGHWVNTVNLNMGGRARFVRGPWKAGDVLGTYGFDPKTGVAWAVVNHTGAFAPADR